MIKLYHPTVKSRPLKVKLNKKELEKLVVVECGKMKAIRKGRRSYEME